MRQTERERGTERKRETERGRERQRYRNREGDKEMRGTGRERKERQGETHTDRRRDRETERQGGREREGERERQRGRERHGGRMCKNGTWTGKELRWPRPWCLCSSTPGAGKSGMFVAVPRVLKDSARAASRQVAHSRVAVCWVYSSQRSENWRSTEHRVSPAGLD
jgi:hypothetical protein